LAEECEIISKGLKKKLLLAKNKQGITAWHLTAQIGNLMAFEALWLWAKGTEINPDDMLLDQDENGFTVLHLVALENHEKNIKEIVGLV